MPRADIEKQNTNPVDVVERLAAVNEWSFARASDDEVTLVVAGRWTDYQVSFTWMPEIEALHLACAFDLRVPERRRPEVTELAALYRFCPLESAVYIRILSDSPRAVNELHRGRVEEKFKKKIGVACVRLACATHNRAAGGTANVSHRLQRAVPRQPVGSGRAHGHDQ